MTKEDFCAWAEKQGYVRDRFGHYHKEDRCFKIQATSVRLEKSYHTETTDYSTSEKRWIKIGSGYFKRLSIDDEGKLKGLTK